VIAATLSEQRCLRHPHREAVARCPECGHFFCRECVIEHERRVLCADCLATILQRAERRGSVFTQLLGALLGCVGLITAWLFFNLLGTTLARAPASFHEGTVWENVMPQP
jgi:hypothetical protein